MHLVNENDPILRKMCEPFDFDSDEDLDFIFSEMHQIMKDKNGVGLAAPQVGSDKRIFIMSHEGRTFRCINPEVLDFYDERILYNEGCLSFPNLRLNIKRSKIVTVRWFNEDGREHQDRLDMLWSRIFQHETDHINGIVFTDRVSKLKLNMALKKRSKHFNE